MKIYTETLGEIAPPMGVPVIVTRAPELVYIKREPEGFRAYWKDAGDIERPGELFDSFAVARTETVRAVREKWGCGQ